MGVNRRKGKISKKFQDTERKDIISGLPDELIGQILSFLPTKYAVATSILSSRWRNLYKLSTSLDFDDLVPGTPVNRSCKNPSFGEFVNGVLNQCKKSHVSKFRLKCRSDIEYSVVCDCIKAAFDYEVCELELLISMNWCCNLELPLEPCRKLVVLKLDCSFDLCVPESIIFPELKVLFLKGVTLTRGCSAVSCSDDDVLNEFLRGCPLLEELVIDGCDWGSSDLYFTNRWLRRLTLDTGLTGVLDQLNGSLIYFDVPRLVHLKYCECLAGQYFIRNLDSVVDAHFEVSFNDDDYDDPQDLCDIMLELIKGVPNCEFLYLSRQCYEALSSGDFKLPIFENLTRLELEQDSDVCWNDILLDFLSSSPCLEALTLVQIHGRWSTDDEDILFGEDRVPSCVTSHLKVINIKNFEGYEWEIDMVKYFLENAKVLEEMDIHCEQRRGDQLVWEKRLKRILELFKASETCTIVFR